MDVPHHVECLARLALRFHATVPEVANALNMEPMSLMLKIGINSGPVIGGVIGALLPRYRIFGDTVRMRARSSCMCVRACCDAPQSDLPRKYWATRHVCS